MSELNWEKTSDNNKQMKPWLLQNDLLRLQVDLIMTKLKMSISKISYGGDWDRIDVQHEKKLIKEDISNGEITLPQIVDSINRSYEEDNEMVYVFRFCGIDDDLKRQKYFLISTMDGLFFFVHKKIAFVEYDALLSVSQDSNGVVITASKVDWYSEEGTEEAGDNEVIIEKNKETEIYLRTLRKGIERIIDDLEEYIVPSEEKVWEMITKIHMPTDKKVTKIISENIMKIPKSTTAVSYLVKDFDWSDGKSEKRMKNALYKYALKVRKDEVVGFIDTSLFGNGGSGILFSKYGIAFEYIFRKVFVKYEEIDRMEIKNGKELFLYGDFEENKEACEILSIDNIYYNLPALKGCLEEIMYVT